MLVDITANGKIQRLTFKNDHLVCQTVKIFDTIKEIRVNVCEMQSRENWVYLSVVVKLCLNIFCDHVSQFLID